MSNLSLSVGILDHKPYLFQHDMCLKCTGGLFGSNYPPNASAININSIVISLRVNDLMTMFTTG